jgi:hypothetical protein
MTKGREFYKNKLFMSITNTAVNKLECLTLSFNFHLVKYFWASLELIRVGLHY